MLDISILARDMFTVSVRNHVEPPTPYPQPHLVKSFGHFSKKFFVMKDIMVWV